MNPNFEQFCEKIELCLRNTHW